MGSPKRCDPSIVNTSGVRLPRRWTAPKREKPWRSSRSLSVTRVRVSRARSERTFGLGGNVDKIDDNIWSEVIQAWWLQVGVDALRSVVYPSINPSAARTVDRRGRNTKADGGAPVKRVRREPGCPEEHSFRCRGASKHCLSAGLLSFSFS